jgi:hypothetical protein
MSELSHRYAEGTAQAWDRLMEQEDRDTARSEARDPRVYKPEDGHKFEPIINSRHYCALCGYGQHLHLNKEQS